jgi:hypothetical protein
MARAFSGGNWIFHKQTQILTAQMHMHAGPRLAMLRAFYLTQRQSNAEAQLWAYVDDFRLPSTLFAACIPLAFLSGKRHPGRMPRSRVGKPGFSGVIGQWCVCCGFIELRVPPLAAQSAVMFER